MLQLFSLELQAKIRKILDPALASNIAGASYVEADVQFLEGMIAHHRQAIVMSKLAKKRTNNKTILDLANRIDVSQEDEINFMESWLKSRKEIKTNDSHSHHMHMEMARNGISKTTYRT